MCPKTAFEKTGADRGILMIAKPRWIRANRCSVFLLTLVVVLVLATKAVAGESTVTIRFAALNANDGVYDGAYAGIYMGTVNGVPTLFVCDDFFTDITEGQSWQANVNSSNPANDTPVTGNLFSPGSITNPTVIAWETSNGDLTQQQEYNVLSWLVEQIFLNPANSDPNSASGWAALGGAIWSITDGAWSASDYVSSGAEADVLTALSNYNDTNLPTYTVYTPDPNDAGQEFFALTPTPEPTSLLLFGTGIVGIAFAMRKKRGRTNLAAI
jgi:hypothetical protein